MKTRFALTLACLWLAAAPASGQLAGLGLPEVPVVGEVLSELPDADETLGALEQTTRQRTRDLLRRHRRELEADPDGQPIVRSQIIALAPSEAALSAARAAGFDIIRSDDLGESGALVTLRAPPSLSTRRALRVLREADPNGTYDFDHLHIESGGVAAAPTIAQMSASGGGPRIGLIDTGVDAPRGFSGVLVEQRGFASERAVPGAHGAAVAALASSAAANARFYVADIYGGAPTGGASSAMARSLAWLASENVPVINVSLVGPRNRIVEAMVARLTGQGILIVAAVGNDGPAAAPLFPAAYPGVVGVTGVDQRQRVLVEAGRGAQVDFSAPGIVDRRVRGTSYAAPIVAGLLAMHSSSPGAANAQRALAALRARARDLGARGRDDVYGEGYVDTNSTIAAR
jgi:subtilisin family serine protease